MKDHARRAGCVLLSLFLWAPASQALPVSGRVVDFRAQPVARAQVAVYERYWAVNEVAGRLVGPIVHTDRRGSFTLETEMVSQRETFIVARKDGLALTWYGLNLTNDDYTKERGHILLVMEKPAELTGVVVDAAGRPVSGAQVQALPRTSYHSILSYQPIVAPAEWFTTRTDDAGRFRFGAFCADVSASFRVRATGWASTYEFTTHHDYYFGFEVGRADIRLVLPPEGKVTGRVVEQESGEPVPNVNLVIRPKKAQPEDIDKLYLANYTVSDANGCFVFAGVPQRAHLVSTPTPEMPTAEWASQPVTVEVKAGVATEPVTITATKAGTIEVTACSESSGQPLPHLSVGWHDYELRAWRCIYTDAQGVARLRVLPGGREIVAWGLGFDTWHGYEEYVDAGETVRLEAKLSARNRISGTVRGRDGVPVPHVFVKAHPYGDEVYTDETGSFTTGCNPMENLQGNWVIALDERQGRTAVGPITAKDKPVELVLQPALRVTGLVADANGTPIPAARVALSVRTAVYLSEFGVETLTDPNGRFRLAVVPVPEGGFYYTLFIRATDYGPKLESRVAVTGGPGDTCDLGTITLPTANQSLAGVVVDNHGQPRPRLPISLFAYIGGGQPNKRTTTDEQGRFRITRICRGTVKLQLGLDTGPGTTSTITAEAGRQDLRIVLPGHVFRYAELVGKPLPELTHFAFPAPPPNVENHPMLVCFFDMAQQPSCLALVELAKQADNLKQKGLTVLAVYVLWIDDNSLGMWARSRSIPFPVGRITEPTAQVRAAWGVQSLPWLILTDARHIVRAEGLAVDELDARIETIAKASGAAGSAMTPARESTRELRTAVCLVKDTQGRALANDRVVVSPATAKCPTDAEGKLSIQYAPPADPRGQLTYVRHKNPDLIGATWLPQAGGAAEVKLEPAVSVQGRVLDPNGQPIGGVQVAALPMSSQFVFTDTAGNFDIAWAREWEPGDNLCLMARREASNWATLVDFDRQTKTVEIRLEPALTLAGAIEDENSQPIAGARVSLSLGKSWRCGTPVEPVTTDAAGRYAFRALPQKQEYVVSARATDYWEDGLSTGLIYNKQAVASPGRIVLRKPVLSVSGVVVDGAGKPIANIRVGTKEDHQPARTTQTDAKGRFTLQGVCSGEVEIWAKLDRAFYGTAATQAGRQDVRLVVQPIR